MNNEQLTACVRQKRDNAIYLPYHTPTQERTLKALMLLLGPETDYEMRLQAARRLARQGTAMLPLLLHTLSHYPEITSPAWPAWPPQYEHCGRLLLHLCQQAHLPLENILQHAILTQPIGPVLWISVIEAVDVLPAAAHETLLHDGLQTEWETTRYSAAMSLANLAGTMPLQEETLVTLRTCQHPHETLPVRLAASYALLRCEDTSGIEMLIRLLTENVPDEVRKATVFVLASEPPTHLSPQQQNQLSQLLLHALTEEQHDIRQYAARALGGIAVPSTPHLLHPLLTATATPSTQVAALLALEEMAKRNDIRSAMRRHILASDILPLLRSTHHEVRQQASYTLASIGGPFVMAALGTALFLHEQRGHVEAIEGLRLVHGVLRTPTCTHAVQWLLSTLRSSQEKIQVTALDSLAYLVWRTRTQRHKTANVALCSAILEDGMPMQLLASSSAWVRQRAIELLCMLDNQPPILHKQLIHLLHTDGDSGVRACIAYILGQVHADWAIPHLLHTLLDIDTQVAITALHALGELATPENAIVMYSIQELALLRHIKNGEENELVTEAQLLLKVWRKK
jgi:HEAT repeat protein